MKKSGFSLMEVLMVMGIIGVVTAMGLSISQKGLERAYRYYWYTGYKALADATFDAGQKDKLSNFSDYNIHVRTLLKLDNSGRAPNGIQFSLGAYQGLRFIAMTIPSPKTKKTMKTTSTFLYDTSTGVLYPANMAATPETNINLQDRVDILPFIISDGLPQSSSSHDNKLYSYKEAYCKTHNNQSINLGNSLLNLTCPAGLTPVDGVMLLVDPKKVF